MKQPDFQLKVENSDSHLSLKDVPAKEVAQLISTMADIIEQAAPDGDCESVGVSLTSVSEKSIFIGNQLSERCRIGAAILLTAIATKDYSALPLNAHDKLVAFSRNLIGQGRVARLSGSVGVEVEISSAHPIPEIKPRLVKHRTTIYGQVVSAGGLRTLKASLVLKSTGRVLEIQVDNADLVKQLANRMYEVVGVKGTAWTDLKSEKMISFEAEELTRFRGGLADPVAALKQIAAECPDAWAGVDVPQVISEMRGEEVAQ